MPRIGVVQPSPEQEPPYWQTTDGETVRLYQGDVLETLRKLPAKSVQCVVTSPPYWGLRDYGTGTWTGGDPGCDHKRPSQTPKLHLDRNGKVGTNNTNWDHRHEESGRLCGKCGATRIDHQLGSEASSDCLGWAKGDNCAAKDWATGCHVCRMVLVFREVRRVLRDDGTLWLDYGDSYNNSGSNRNGEGLYGKRRGGATGPNGSLGYKNKDTRHSLLGLPSGSLCGVPWRVALALQADGWVLRQDIIWHKPSPMPEGVRNRCTKAHEYVFLLTKSNKYFCDMEAIREKTGSEASPEDYYPEDYYEGDGRRHFHEHDNERGMLQYNPNFNPKTHPNGRNKRSVWTADAEDALGRWLAANAPELLEMFLAESANKGDVWRVASPGYPGAHYATFPPKLITPCILAGTSEYGCCADCGAPWRRITEETKLWRKRPNEYVKRTGEKGTGNFIKLTVAGVETKTLGWQPTCECHGRLEKVRIPKTLAASYAARVAVTGTPVGGTIVDGHNSTHAKGVSHDLDSGDRIGIEGESVESVEYVSDLPLDQHPVRPCVVLDPFIGSGTTAVVALEYGRRSIGIDLSRDYLDKNAIPRIKAWLNARLAYRHLASPPRPNVGTVRGRSCRAKN